MRGIAVYPGTRRVGLIERDPPSGLQPTQALLRVREVGICGTDREIASFQHGAPPSGSDYLIIGHESVAEVVETGAEVRSLWPGDMVVPMVRRPCPHSSRLACRANRPDFCITGDYQESGIKQAHGFLTEFVTEDEAYLVPIPSAIADVAVLVEPLTIVAKAALEGSAILGRLPYEPHRSRCLAIGAGAIGLLGAMVAVARGYETYVFSREPATSERAKLVESFGATYISAEDTPANLISHNYGTFDVIFEAAGVPHLAFEVLAALSPNGGFIFTGVPSPEQLHEINLGRVMRDLVLKNQVLFGTVNASRSSYEAAVQGLVQGMTLFPESVQSLITAREPLEAAEELLWRRDGIKNVVQIAAHSSGV
jgi:threonine dehydrogenase-like Zn-dependent dehydrogenase